MTKSRVLIIEDDRSLADIVAYNLRQEGFDVLIARDGQDGLTQAQLKRPDLIVLDLMLPVVDGLAVCRRLRADSATKHILIVMLTAKAEESDEVVGFSMGADDYVTKPFSVRVLAERIKALLRRREMESDEESDEVVYLGVAIDRRRYRVALNGELLALTRSEFRLLDTLIRQPGRVFSRQELIDSSLGGDAIVQDRTIDVHIRSLRSKFGDSCDLIETVRGVGYRFRESDAPAE